MNRLLFWLVLAGIPKENKAEYLGCASGDVGCCKPVGMHGNDLAYALCDLHRSCLTTCP